MIYVGLPVHDERHTVGVLMWRIRKEMVREDQDFRVVVVDDGSTDGTAGVLEPYRRILPLKVLSHDRPRGYAACLERIVRLVLDDSGYHKRDALLTLEADFTHDPAAVPEMLRAFQSGADLVHGVPRRRGSVPRAVRWARRLVSLAAGDLPLPPEVEDPFGGFRLHRLFVLRRLLEELDEGEPMLRYDGWAANAELLIRALPHARQVEQVDFDLDYARRYRDSRFRLLSELWDVFRAGRDRELRRSGPELRVEGGAG